MQPIMIKNYIRKCNKNPVKVLNEMIRHPSHYWFTSLIGFFYQSGIGCDPDRNRAMELYLLAINDEKDFQIENFSKFIEIIIKNKYLSFFNLFQNLSCFFND